MPPILYLDTSHISEIVRNPMDATNRAILHSLEKGEAELGVWVVHLLELTDPNFKSFDSARDLLSDVPVRMALDRRFVIEDEVALACSRISGQSRRPPRVFVENLEDWAVTVAMPPGFSVIDVLDFLRDNESHRKSGLAVAQDGATWSVLKENAAVAQNRLSIAALYVRDHLEKIRPANPFYVSGLTPEEIIKHAGGLSAFPMLFVMLTIARERLIYPGKKTKRNDIIDEYHASYSPYAAVTTLDGPTFARYRDAKLPYLARVTTRVDEVSKILVRVIAGDLQVEPSV